MHQSDPSSTVGGVAYPIRQTDTHPDRLPDSLPALVEEWHQTMVARRMADARNYKAMVLSVVEFCGWKSIKDADVRSISRWFAEFAPTRASSTAANHLSALVKFFGWAHKLGLIDHNPAKAVEPPAFERGHGSRACQPQELARLVEAARAAIAADNRAKKSDRTSQYIVSAYVGLRRLELSKLRVRMFEDGEPAWLNLEARVGKGRKPKAVRVPVHPEAAAVLRGLVRGRRTDDPIFRAKFVEDVTFSNDLKRAGIPEYDARGRKLTFHGLRKTFATNMARYGVGQRAAQALMRHSDPKMTANVYQDAELLPLAAELAKVPSLEQMASRDASVKVIHNLKKQFDSGASPTDTGSSDAVLPFQVDSRKPLAAALHGVTSISVVAGGFGLSQSWCLPLGSHVNP